MSVIITKLGDKRKSTRTFEKGSHIEYKDQVIHFTEDTVVQVTEVFQYKYPSLKSNLMWAITEYHWDTGKPVQEERPTPEVIKPGFWARLWARLTRKGLPTARLVKG